MPARPLLLAGLMAVMATSSLPAQDYIRDLQTAAVRAKAADVGHWGAEPQNYVSWGSHSNRLIPVYTFGTLGAGKGVDLTSYTGANSPYRSEQELKRIYGRLPSNTLNPEAEYLDQTNLYDIQKAAFAAGKKHVFLVVFDGMDWDTTRNAAIDTRQKIEYDAGRGTGLHFQDYTAGGTTQFGYMCTSPHNNGTEVDVDAQTVKNPGGTMFGGYSVTHGGPNPWTPGSAPLYVIGKDPDPAFQHAYTDSSSSASSMTAGYKTYNNGVNVDATGAQFETIAHQVQAQGYTVGAVSSVPISHATPACAYAHNVERDDYQDITRDLIGLKSISHPNQPLSGLDVIIGTGWGDSRQKDAAQGKNFVPGNAVLTNADRDAVDIQNGGKYVVSERSAGQSGHNHLLADAKSAAAGGHRLLGFYGVAATKHLPFATADGDFQPAPGRSDKSEVYMPADVFENPTIADMTTAAITVLSKNPKGFWLLVEPGDVDWANHDNNLDNSIGAVKSGDKAVKVITDWVEQHSNWQESLLIVTADHGHYFVLQRPDLLVAPARTASRR